MKVGREHTKGMKEKSDGYLETKVRVETNELQYSFDECARNKRGFEAMVDEVCEHTV